MGRYVLKRCWTMLWTLLLVSILIFWIVNLPPGDVLTNQIQQLRASGEGAAVAKADRAHLQALHARQEDKALGPIKAKKNSHALSRSVWKSSSELG